MNLGKLILFFLCITVKTLSCAALFDTAEQTLATLVKDDHPNSLNVLRSFLNQYSRPFTLIEINPGVNPFSYKLCKSYDCTCVVFEPFYSKEVLKRCLSTKFNNLLLFSKKMEAQHYHMLAECEHFDVALIPNFDNRATDQALIKALLELADHTLIELITPGQQPDRSNHEDSKEVDTTQGGRKKTDNSTRRWYLISKPRTYIAKKIWNQKRKIKPLGFYGIESTFSSKAFIHQLRGRLPWHKGINLNTFVKLHGIYPSKEQIRTTLTGFKDSTHNDLWLGNMVIQGYHIELIDINDPLHNEDFQEQFNHLLTYFD